eukprot:3194731-Alexandrium_andersonii.AAC.1
MDARKLATPGSSRAAAGSCVRRGARLQQGAIRNCVYIPRPYPRMVALAASSTMLAVESQPGQMRS